MIKLADDVVAHILEQVVADDTDDWVEERNVFNNVGGVVTPLEECVDARREVVGEVVAQHALKQAQHIVLDAELVLDGRVTQVNKEQCAEAL